MPNTKTVHISEMKESLQASMAQVVKTEMEGRTHIQTKGVSEWVRVMQLASVSFVINYDTQKFDVEPQSKQVLELLVREYLLVRVKKGGPPHD